jgi:DNA-binding MarR family transcriptional regulator
VSAGHLRIPHIFLDSGIVSAIGLDRFAVYCEIRRFVRTESAWHPRVEALRKEGYLVAYANQTKIGLLLGLSRSTVTRSIKVLKQVGWIHERRLKDNLRAYVVGFRSDPDSKGRSVDIYLADEWLKRVLEALPPEQRSGWNEQIGVRHNALVGKLQRVIDGDCVTETQR